MKGSGIPNQFLGVLLHTIAMSGFSRVRTELAQLCVIPFLAHHPIEANCELSRHAISALILSDSAKRSVTFQQALRTFAQNHKRLGAPRFGNHL